MRDFERNIKKEKRKYSWDQMAEAIENLTRDFQSRIPNHES
jgi:hypothetical protein